MKFSESGPSVDPKPGFFESVKKFFNREKPQTGSDRLALLQTSLQDSKKSDLARTIRTMRDLDAANKKPDLSAYSASLFAEEIASGAVEIKELFVLAEAFAEYKNNPPKKPDPGYVNTLAQKISSELRYRAISGIQFKRALGEIIPYEEEEILLEKIRQKALKLAEKIVNAPKKLTSDMSDFADQLEAEVVKKQNTFLVESHGDLTEADLQKIISLYPDEYREMADQHELVAAKARLIETPGTDQCVQALRDLTVNFSGVDGAMFKTPAERLAYAETLASPGEIKAKWYETKPSGYDKTFAREFTSKEVIPWAIATNKPLDELARELHWYQTAGSPDQLSHIKAAGKDLAGNYRRETVWVGNYNCPSHELVPEMMSKFTAQVESFSVQLEARRDSLSPDEFEKQALQYACLVLNRFGAIHPMADGNGRTARSLYEYIIAKHLGPEKMTEYSTRHFGPEETIPYEMKASQVNMNLSEPLEFRAGNPLYETMMTKDPAAINRAGMWHAPLMAHLGILDFDQEVVNDPELVKFTENMRAAIVATKK